MRLFTSIVMVMGGLGAWVLWAVPETRGFAPAVRVGEQELKLNGTGLRTATWLGIEVYRAALYLDDPTTDSKQVIESTAPKQVELVFLRSVDREKIRDAWQQAFKKYCGECSDIQDQLALLLSTLGDTTKGDRHVYRFRGQGVELEMAGKPPIQFKNAGTFARGLLNAWVGEAAPSESFRKELLGGG